MKRNGFFLLAAFAAALFGFQVSEEKSEEKALAFPASWKGIWKGTCKAQKPGGRAYEFAMELHIAPAADPERLTWKIVYGKGERQQVRDYELVTVNSKEGHFLVDEKNSIEIDAYLVNDALHSQYAVGGGLITVIYTRKEGAILFSLISSKQKEPIVSGGRDEIPAVSTYPVEVVQHASLEKE